VLFMCDIRLQPLPPNDAVRKQKKIFQRIFIAHYCPNLKNKPSEHLKFNNLGVFQSLKLHSLMGKILKISLDLNFFLNTMGCYGL